jgi:plasmid maintenance system antidote protein VapI
MNERLVRVPAILSGFQADMDWTVETMARPLCRSQLQLLTVLKGVTQLSIPMAVRIEAMYGLDARELLIMQLDERLANEREARGIGGYKPQGESHA